MSQLSRVSVVIPAYNSAKTIAKTLTAVQSQSFSDIEVIVVDDGSKDSTSHIVKSFPEIKYFYQENAGPAAARNFGASKATSGIILFTDSDCVPQPDWISKILEGFFDDNIGVVCGSYGIANPESLLARCIHKEIIFRHEKLMGEYPKAFGSYNFAVRKNVFENVRGFNVAYRNASGEDNDLSYKILKAGYKIYFKKNAFVDHYHSSQFVKYLKEQFRHGYWRVQMYKDHPEMMKGDDYTFWKDIAEPPIALLIIFLLLMSCIFPSWFTILILIVYLFFILEIIFAFLMTRKFFEAIYFGFVMLMRAFSRTIGFSTGIIALSLKKNIKKM